MALPGGVGTLDELIDTLALMHLNQYSGKMFVLDHEGFYQPLKQLLLHYVNTGMLKKETYELVGFASTPDELLEMLASSKLTNEQIEKLIINLCPYDKRCKQAKSQEGSQSEIGHREDI